MKHISTVEKRRQKSEAAHDHNSSVRSRPTPRGEWLMMPNTEEGSDAAYEKLIERIVRGDRIRGYTL